MEGNLEFLICMNDFKIKKILVVLLCIFFIGIVLWFYRYFSYKKPQNLVIISIDTLRADHMGIYGYDKDTTPYIDALAKNSITFTNVRTVVPMTYPSFVALMTGLDPFHTRILANRDQKIENNTETLATILKRSGYANAAFTTGALSPETGLLKGFDKKEYMYYKSFFNFPAEDDHQVFYQTSRNEYESLVDNSIAWLKNNKQEKFFLWVHLLDPHAPYQPPDDLRCRFNKSYCTVIKNTSDKDLELLRAQNQFCQESPVRKETVGLMETLYDGGVAYSDRLTGRILQALKDSGVDDNTLVVIYGDHGEGFDHNYYFNHRGVLYDSAIRIPLIIRNPSSVTKEKSSMLIQNTDIFPTLLDLLGMQSPSVAEAQRMSFANVFKAFSLLDMFYPKRKASFSVNNDLSKYAVVDGGYKYIYSLPQSCLLNQQTEELYNIKADAEENNNVLLKEKEKAKTLRSLLMNYLKQFNLPLSKVASQGGSINESNEHTQDAIDVLRSLGY